MHSIIRASAFGITFILATSAIGLAQDQIRESGLPQLERVEGYLGSDVPAPGPFLPPPPAADSTEGRAEMQIFRDTRALEGTPRWEMAERDVAGDSASMFAAFSCALGADITPDQAPATSLLIRRAMADVSPIIGAQKNLYARPRPFALEMLPACAPSYSEGLRESGAYPSGHSTVGWTWALVLASLAPDRASEIVGRGRAFGESRVVCGVHYPSDVHAGQTTATVVFVALQSNAEYIAERDAAREELDMLRASAPAPDAATCAEEAGLVRQRPW